MDEFLCSTLNKHIRDLQKDEKVVILGDTNEKRDKVVGKWRGWNK